MATTRIVRSVARTATRSTHRATTGVGRMIWRRLPWPAKVLAPLVVLGGAFQALGTFFG